MPSFSNIRLRYSRVERRIQWSFSTLCTVTYGKSCALFLAVRVLEQLARDEHPITIAVKIEECNGIPKTMYCPMLRSLTLNAARCYKTASFAIWLTNTWSSRYSGACGSTVQDPFPRTLASWPGLGFKTRTEAGWVVADLSRRYQPHNTLKNSTLCTQRLIKNLNYMDFQTYL